RRSRRPPGPVPLALGGLARRQLLRRPPGAVAGGVLLRGLPPLALAGRYGRGLRVRPPVAPRPRASAPVAAGPRRRADPAFRGLTGREPIRRPVPLVSAAERPVHLLLLHELLEVSAVPAVPAGDARPRCPRARPARPPARPSQPRVRDLRAGAVVLLP